MKKWSVRITGTLLVVLFSLMDTWAQCAMCRGSVESTMGNGRNNIGIGLNFGIAYLFVIPYLTFALIAYLWYRNSKKLQKERQLVASGMRDAFGA